MHSPSFSSRLQRLAAALLSLLALTAAQDAGVPVISSITGCPSFEGAGTSGCIPPVQLTLSGSNFGQGQLVNVSGVLITSFGGSASLLYAYLTLGDYPVPIGTPVPVTVVDPVLSLTSAPAPLLTFSSYSRFILRSVSGCEDRGDASTYNCNTTTAMVTIRGSGFTPDMGAGTATAFAFYFTATSGMVARSASSLRYVDSGTATFNLSDFLLAARLPNTSQVSFFLSRSTLMSSAPLTLTFIPTPTNSGPPPVTTPKNVTITSITGCPVLLPVNGGNGTSGCSKPFTLTVTGSGFPSVGAVVLLGGERCTALMVSATQIFCRLDLSFTQTPTGVFLPVVVWDLYNLIQSAPFYGVQLAPQVAPYIASISGCQGSGASTLQCNPNTDSITLTGSGFVVDGQSWTMIIGNARPYLSASLIVDSGTMVVPLLTSFQGTSGTAMTYNSSVMVLLVHGNLLSNAVTISVQPPLLNVTQILSSGCTSIPPLRLVDCVPGVSTMTVYGFGFVAPLLITVAGSPCAVWYTSTYVICTLPAPEGFSPGFLYDLVIAQPAPAGNSLTIPSAVAFTFKPTISSLTSQFCPSDFVGSTSYFVLNCGAGDVLTILGSFFSPSDALTVTFSYNGFVKRCDSVTLVSSSVLLCVLPVLNVTESPRLRGMYVQVRVSENATFASNAILARLYRLTTDPVVYNVSGCSGPMLGTRGVQGCSTGSSITVYGDNFAGSGAAVDIYEQEEAVSYLCQQVTALSRTVISCRMPYILRSNSDVVLPLRVRTTSSITVAASSNWLPAIGYEDGLSNDSSQESGRSWYSAFMACVVLLSVVSVALLASVTLNVYLRSQLSGSLLGKASSSDYRAERDNSQLGTSRRGGFAVELH